VIVRLRAITCRCILGLKFIQQDIRGSPRTDSAQLREEPQNPAVGYLARTVIKRFPSSNCQSIDGVLRQQLLPVPAPLTPSDDCALSNLDSSKKVAYFVC
jgi:hypothetical protein